jgi:hypothetical protein
VEGLVLGAHTTVYSAFSIYHYAMQSVRQIVTAKHNLPSANTPQGRPLGRRHRLAEIEQFRCKLSSRTHHLERSRCTDESEVDDAGQPEVGEAGVADIDDESA